MALDSTTTTPTLPAERPNQVLLAITRAQHAALHWMASPKRQRHDTDPGSRCRDSVRSKRLCTSHLKRGSYYSYTYRLTAAGRAILRALDWLTHQASRRRRRG